MDIGKLQFMLADRRFLTADLLRKCSLNITEAVKSRNFRSCFPEMQWRRFHSVPRFQQHFS